ncbi:MAG: hypothetical protein HY510_04600 [Acidobacteria bacterium]|nr:hypothetical protein [Acidobacteriota bacterium]
MMPSRTRRTCRILPFLSAAACVTLLTMRSEAGALDPPSIPPPPVVSGIARSFSPGDVLVSLRTGEVQWRDRDGSLLGVLVNLVPGKAEGMGFDAAGNLYVSHYCADASACLAGNAVERFSPQGISLGRFGSGYDCNPYAFAFDRPGNVYVGQADCTGDIRQLDLSGAFRTAYDVAAENRGSARIDLAADGCTLFYTSQGPNVKRYDLCSRRQLPDFNVAPVPGGYTGSLRILPDGGLIVATASDVTRLDSAGRAVRTYDLADEPDLWIGLDLAGDGTFWAANYGSSDVCRFDLSTGALLGRFNTGTPTTTVKDVLVKR